MKTLFFNVFFLLLSPWAFAQSFSAEIIGEVFMGYPDGNFSTVFKIVSGSLKKGDKVDIYAETGRKFTCTINKIEIDEVGDNRIADLAKAGETAFVDFFTSDNTTGGADYLKKGYKIYPSGFKVPEGANAVSTVISQKTQFNTTLDGKAFKGSVTYKGATLWRKGVKNYQERPYLMLQFASVDAIDNRTLTVQVFNPQEAPAKYSAKDMEVNFSGAKDGKKENTTIFGFINGKANPPFVLEVTKWQKISMDKAIISGKISGELPEVSLFGVGKRLNKFENGIFEGVEVEIFSTQPDMKEIMNRGKN